MAIGAGGMTRVAGTRSSRNSNKSSPPKVDPGTGTSIRHNYVVEQRDTNQVELTPTNQVDRVCQLSAVVLLLLLIVGPRKKTIVQIRI